MIRTPLVPESSVPSTPTGVGMLALVGRCGFESRAFARREPIGFSRSRPSTEPPLAPQEGHQSFSWGSPHRKWRDEDGHA